MHIHRDETFLTQSGTWKGVVVLIVATHRSTQGFRQFDGSLLSCGHIQMMKEISCTPRIRRVFVNKHVDTIGNRRTCNIYIYIPGTQMTLVLNGKGLLLEGSNPKNRGQTGSRYIYMQVCFSGRKGLIAHAVQDSTAPDRITPAPFSKTGNLAYMDGLKDQNSQQNPPNSPSAPKDTVKQHERDFFQILHASNIYIYILLFRLKFLHVKNIFKKKGKKRKKKFSFFSPVLISIN